MLKVWLLPWLPTCLSLTSEFLDCDWDEDWRTFRVKLTENARRGFPKDPDLESEAKALLQSSWPQLQPDENAIYGMSLAMQSFFLSCNTQPGSVEELTHPFCLYGAVAAMWVCARHGHPEAGGLLKHAKFLLGDVFRSALDFMEGSSWPLTSIDLMANDGLRDFRLPQELQKEYGTPARHRRQASGPPGRPPVFAVWEMGVHASLSAEPLQMWARILPVELRHRNLIRDQYPQWLPKKCEILYGHPKLRCDDVQDDLTELFREWIPHSASSKDPVEDMSGLVTEFQRRFRASSAAGAGGKVDLFLCTIAYLCLLVEPLGTPIVGYFGHPLLFLVPDVEETREDFWQRFMGMARSRSVAFAVSDPFLQMQYEYQVGHPRMDVIRTHALYTRAMHFPARTDEVLVLDRPHESVLMCLLRRSMAGDATDWRTAEGRLREAISPEYPYRFITRALTDKQFSTFAKFRAVVLWAYDMDLITFYEFYSMNMPIFMPSHLSKYIFHQDHGVYNYQWKKRRLDFGTQELWPSGAEESPFQERSLDAVRRILPFTDYFRFPHVLYFESIPDLLVRLPETDFFGVSQSMASFNQDALIATSNAWQRLLRRLDLSFV